MTDIDPKLRQVLSDVLGLSPARRDALAPGSPLFGALPELDSMAVATLFGAIEEKFDLFINDDEISGEVLETYGTLLAFVNAKTAA
ncbi:acyl carrier protein [Novosphingobium sp.]|uniref:acyl carrier protein n=1 Tax=Novosphingobium sp. TaxID=1874826 RepID=UPI003B51A648